MSKKSYSEKLKHPKWQRKRLEIMQRDGFKCSICNDEDTTLHVHHLEYADGEPWDIDNSKLVTLCENCHTQVEICKKDFDFFDYNNLNIIKYEYDNDSLLYFIQHKDIILIRYNKSGFYLSVEQINELNKLKNKTNKWNRENPF